VRITFVIPKPDLSGGIRVVAIYAQRLRQRGHDVTVVSTPAVPTPLRRRIKHVLTDWRTWRELIPDNAPSPSHMDDVDVPHYVIDRFRPVTDVDVPDADVVIATWWETAEWVANLSPRKGAKVFFIQHHEVFDYLPVDRVKATWRLPLHKVTISQWLVDLAADTYGDRDVSLVLNSVDTGQFHAPPRDRQTQPTVGLMYSTVPWKGCEVSLRAIQLASESIDNLRLVAFGSEQVSPDLPLPSGIDSTFHHRPAQNTIRNLYAQCDVWLCGSFAEGFHLPPLEAMACRCPVVSTRVGGPIDVIQEAVNGYTVPVGNADVLAQRLVDVLQSTDAAWRAMSEAAHQTATGYTWDDATALFERGLFYAIEKSQRRASA